MTLPKETSDSEAEARNIRKRWALDVRARGELRYRIITTWRDPQGRLMGSWRWAPFGAVPPLDEFAGAFGA